MDTLRRIHSDKLTDNFVYVDLSPARDEFVDAFDDAGWKQVVDHLRIAAWVAREGGLKGVMFDPEAYQGSIVRYDSRLHAETSFADYAAKVRQRGREAMQAMASVYPDMTFFTLFMHSGIAMGAFGLDPREGLEAAGGRDGRDLVRRRRGLRDRRQLRAPCVSGPVLPEIGGQGHAQVATEAPRRRLVDLGVTRRRMAAVVAWTLVPS